MAATPDNFDIHPRAIIVATACETAGLDSRHRPRVSSGTDTGTQAEHGRHHEHAAVAILNASNMNDGMGQEALRIDENMSLLAFNAADQSEPLSAHFHALAIDDDGTDSAAFCIKLI